MIHHKIPRLDLHGEECALVNVLVNAFIKDNYNMGNNEVVIIHGKSTNILTEEVHKTLSNNNLVTSYKLDNWNLGQTIVNIKSK